MNSGYPLEWFAEHVDDYLKCGICNKVLQNPCATSCGHVFCKDCLQSWIEYYGICPERCGEVEPQQVTRPLHIEKRISGLLVRCKYVRSGCNVQVQLADKHKHELSCSFRGKDPVHGFDLRRRHSADDNSPRSPPCARVAFKRSSSATNGPAPRAAASTPSLNKMQSQHTYRLKRTRQKEPLGLVVLSGSKTSDGRPKDFFVKKVNPGTPASKAGLKPGDRIIQIDNHDLWKISIQEAVARIKEQPTLTLTILRWESVNQHSYPEGLNSNDHIYDEILYADLSQPILSQQDENFPPFPAMSRETSPPSSRRMKPLMTDELQTHPLRVVRPVSPSPGYIYRTSQPQKVPAGEKGSKDSGLSSGSSGSPRPLPRDLERVMGMAVPVRSAGSSSNLDSCPIPSGRQTHCADRHALQSCPINQPEGEAHEYGVLEAESTRGRIEGDYEVEEIYLEKNGTSQLGVTLGYDTKYSRGQLYVCELTPDGLAARDGRIQIGDIIKRVNGFEVYDPEEAVLLFLEQDQDITLTVARKLQSKRSVHLAVNGHSRRGRPRSFETLDSTAVEMSTDFRRIESCGSLDSHSYRPEPETSMQEGLPSPRCQQPRPLRASRENMGSMENTEYERTRFPERSQRAVSPGRTLRKGAPHSLSQPSQLVAGVDHSFRPVPPSEQRPRTTGPVHHRPFLSPQIPRAATSPATLVRPASTTPGTRRRGHQHPAWHSSMGYTDSIPRRQVAKMPRTPQTDVAYTRNESLV